MRNETATELAAVNAEQPGWMQPQNFEQAWKIAETFANSDMVPKAYQGKPGNVIVVMGYADQMGLNYMAALQGTAVINGIPGMYGDLMLAVVRASGELEYIRETMQDNDTAAVCTVKRKGEDEVRQVFTLDDAKRANLLSKSGPWQQYPKRMLKMRARAFALRDVFTDILKGMQSAEELHDIPHAVRPSDLLGGGTAEKSAPDTGTGAVLDQLDAATEKATAAEERQQAKTGSKAKTGKAKSGKPKQAEERPADDAQQPASENPVESTQKGSKPAGGDSEGSEPAGDETPPDARAWIRPVFSRWADRLGRESVFVQMCGDLFRAESLNDFASVCDMVADALTVAEVAAMVTDRERKQYEQFVQFRTEELQFDVVS